MALAVDIMHGRALGNEMHLCDIKCVQCLNSAQFLDGRTSIFVFPIFIKALPK